MAKQKAAAQAAPVTPVAHKRDCSRANNYIIKAISGQ